MQRLIISAVVAASLTGRAMALPVACPASIRLQETAARADRGWVAVPHEADVRPLQAIAVFLSHPSQHEEQIPDKSCRKRDVWVMHGGDEYWLVCQYSGTKVVMASKIDAGIKECVVTYEVKADRSRGAVKGFECHRSIRFGNVTESPSPSDDWEDCQ